MSLGSSGAKSDGSVKQEPPDPDAIEVDPTGRYIRYKDVLGKGAFKTVYRAFDELDGIEVAWNQIKVEDIMQCPEDPERLYSEINLLKSVKHENIVKFYASWIDDEQKTINIITELFTSGNLRQYRRKHKKVDMKAVKAWARHILVGLNYLHSHKPPIIHRDLKCDNIFINGNNGEVKIGDLGLATIVQQDNAKTVIGTPEFMAPELYDEEYNELVDIYSFGMCMLEMVTFEYPYSECTNSAQIFKKVSTGVKPISLSKVKDPEVKAFIEKCLVPACLRLPARDLLRDPFLSLDGSIEAQHNLFSPSCGTKSPEVDDCEHSHVALSESNHHSPKMLSSPTDDMESVTWTSSVGIIDSDSQCMQLEPNPEALENSNPVENGYCNQHLMTSEVEEEWKDYKFRLRGSRSDTGSISLILWIKGPKDYVKSEFPFYLDNDTSSSVATEIVEYFNLAPEDVRFMAHLIDSLFLHLVPGWQPSVLINHTVNACDSTEKSSQFFKAGGNHFGSPHSISEATSSKGSQLCTGPVATCNQVNHEESPFLSSDSSLSSTSQSLENGVKFESRPSNRVGCDGNEMPVDADMAMSKSEISMHLNNQVDQDMDVQTVSEASVFSDLFSGESSTFVDKDDDAEADEELAIELEVLELHFQQVINHIVQERQEAIAAAKKRAADRRKPLLR